ncbi:MAG: hypothetical protein EXS16_13920 [Gemmataceae bacterium]|nr:hypothetical protein [Gemmataceae bacterium]
MPHLVQMHKQHADRGLVVLCVSLDPTNDKEKVDDAIAFLRKLNPPFTRLLLDEPDAVWSKKLDFNNMPCYYVFDRHGKWVRFGGDDGDIDFAEFDRVVLRMLSEK